jgi:hypothetical protein
MMDAKFNLEQTYIKALVVKQHKSLVVIILVIDGLTTDTDCEGAYTNHVS